MSMAIGEGARDADGEFRDMVDAKESSRSEERNSSISFSFCNRLVWLFEGASDGAGLKKAMSSWRLESCTGVRDRCRGEESVSVE
jgi:hypothetical protein